MISLDSELVLNVSLPIHLRFVKIQCLFLFI